MSDLYVTPTSLVNGDRIIVDGVERVVGQERWGNHIAVWSSYSGVVNVYHDGGAIRVRTGETVSGQCWDVERWVQATQATFDRVRADTDRFNVRHGSDLVQSMAVAS